MSIIDELKQSSTKKKYVKIHQPTTQKFPDGSVAGKIILPDGSSVDSFEFLPVEWKQMYYGFKASGGKGNGIPDVAAESPNDPVLEGYKGKKNDKQDWTEVHQEWQGYLAGAFGDLVNLTLKGQSARSAHESIINALIKDNNDDLSKFWFKLTTSKIEGTAFYKLDAVVSKPATKEELDQVGKAEVPF